MLLGLLASCAQSPDMVEPVYVSDVPYRGLSCQQLAIDQDRLLDADQRLSGEQAAASKDDTIGVLLLGLPIGSMVGEDKAEKLARVRGELEAVQTALRTKDCSGPNSIQQN